MERGTLTIAGSLHQSFPKHIREKNLMYMYMSDGYNPIGIYTSGFNDYRIARINQIVSELEQLARQYEELKLIRDYIVWFGKK